MKKQILILAMSLLTLVSCKKDDFTWRNDYFSFLSKTMEIPVYEDTEYFMLKGCQSRALNRIREIEIGVYDERTTAIRGTHYELLDSLMLFAVKAKESEIKVKLIRGSIITPLDLTLYHIFYDPEKDSSKHIDTITVRLIPTIK